MRVLLLGEAGSDKIEQAFRREHVLTDRIPDPERTPPNFGEGLYDAAVTTLPEGRAAEILRAVRADGVDIPILVLAAHASARDRIAALDAGADDFLTQPFLMGELIARVRALARRGSVLRPSLLRAGDLTFDTSQSLLRCGGSAVRLSAREKQLLELFLLNPRQILPRDLLLQKLWGCDAETAYNSVEVYVSLLRRKLRRAGSSLRVCAARGVGYYLETSAD
ncbi:MAG: response regulator transcription factor [Eubacteriales bacterium]|nr:response regulator transcription factor [Eubacteriales bacterium]